MQEARQEESRKAREQVFAPLPRTQMESATHGKIMRRKLRRMSSLKSFLGTRLVMEKLVIPPPTYFDVGYPLTILALVSFCKFLNHATPHVTLPLL
jgi:hypothetical protein